MNPDGSNEVQLTEGVQDNTTPTWVGNDQIAFSSNRTQDWELYLIDVDGSNPARLTYQVGKDQNPAWCSAD
ncbi:MAG: TolB family protein [Candidatus Promineifilaceae bacterium]